MEILTQKSNQATMDSLDLLQVINQYRQQYGESQVRLNDFNARIADELEGEHYESFVVRNPNGTKSQCFHLNLDQCTLVGMRESKAVRKAVLAYIKSKSLPQTFAEALQLAADQARQLELAAPKIAFVDNYVAGKGNKTFRQVAKLLQIKEYKFREFLESNRIMYKLNGEWTAYQNHVDAKRFHVKTGVSDFGHTFNHSLFTPKGIEWVAGELAKAKVREVAA